MVKHWGVSSTGRDNHRPAAIAVQGGRGYLALGIAGGPCLPVKASRAVSRVVESGRAVSSICVSGSILLARSNSWFKERELQVPANVDTDLCEQVATGLGLSAPKGKPAENVAVSPALVQILGEPGRIDGRKIGIIADAGSDLAGVSKLVKATAALGITALVIAPVGGVLKAGCRTVTVDRALGTARSIEFDAHGATAALCSSLRTSPARTIDVAEDVDKAFTANLAGAGSASGLGPGRQSHFVRRPARRLTIVASSRGRQLRKLGLRR